MSTTFSLQNFHIMGSRILSRSFHVERWEGGEDEDDTQADTCTSITSEDRMDVDEPAKGTIFPGEADCLSAPGVLDDGTEEDEDAEDPSDVAMVPMADMLNAKYKSENARNAPPFPDYEARMFLREFYRPKSSMNVMF